MTQFPSHVQSEGPPLAGENDLSYGALRRQAEAILKGQAPNLEGFSQQDLQSLVHELQVHQIELELQNDALRQTQQALELARDEYAELYDGAPVGYFSIEGDGIIARANATGAALLGVTPSALLGKPFHRFVSRDSQDAYHFFLLRLGRSDGGSSGREASELTLARVDGAQFRARIEGVVSEVDRQGRQGWRATVSDISAEYEAREALRHIAEGTAAVTGAAFFRAMVQHLAHFLDVHYVLLGAIDGDDPGLVHTRAVWAGGDWAEDMTFDLRGTACEQVTRGQACSYTTGVRGHLAHDPILNRWQVDSCHAWPLHDRAGRIQGVLMAMDERPKVVKPGAEPILAVLADRAAAELARQESQVALQRYAGEQSALYTVAATLTTSLEPEKLADSILGVLLPLFEANAGWVVAHGETRSDPARLLASQGLGHLSSDARLLAACPKDYRAAAAYIGGTGGVEPRAVIECQPEPAGLLEQAGLSGCGCLPLAAHGRVLGTLTLAWSSKHALAGRERALLLAIGRQLALSLHNARQYQRARQVDRLRMLVALDEALSASLEPERVATLALERIAAAAHATEAFLLPYSRSLRGDSNRVLSLDEGWIDVETSSTHHRWLRFFETLRRQRQGNLEVGCTASLSITPWSSDVLVVPLDDEVVVADLILTGSTLSDDDVAMARAAAGRVSQALRNARLYDEVRELLRQREETQAMLIQSEKVAALGRLTASFSHEINNPLQSVIGCLALAQGKLGKETDEESIQRYLTVALQEIRRIAVLVQRMRDFYQRGSEDRTGGDIHELLERVAALTRSELQGHNVAIEWECDLQLPAPAIHADQLQQVFLNLILNAIQAMADGGTLTLHTGRDELRRGLSGGVPAVRIDFQDTGPGIPPEVQQRLFEPFFTTKQGGSGLGLYVCHRIVQDHGGEIAIRSRPGEGTRATIWLPLKLPEDSPGGTE